MTIHLSPLKIKDPSQFGKVAVLYGGNSSEREVSLNSGRNVLEGLLSGGIDAFLVDGVANLVTAIQDKKVSRVFNIMHGAAGENGVVQGLLEALGIPYTGSRVLGAALTLDKIRTKQVWLSEGLQTPRYARIAAGSEIGAAVAKIGYPLIIKPALEGSSVGVSRVFGPEGLESAVKLAAGYGRELLMEQLIEGGEYTVAILDGVALPSIQIVPPGEYYDYHAKYVSDDTQYLCPGLEGEDEVEMRNLALAAFHASGASGWGRVDVMRDRQGGNWLLEVNTTPGMTSHSLVPKAAAKAGIPFPALVWRILESSMEGQSE
jgi:D-alanine-D-alanine ligase